MAEKGYFYSTKSNAKTGLGMIIEEHRGQAKKIMNLSLNHLKATYKGALLGPAWAIIKPSFTLFILWFAFSVGLRGNGMVNGYPRFYFMLSGYVPWFYISEAILAGARSVRSNRQYVTKLSFPMSNIMTFTNLSSMYIHLILLVIMYVVLWAGGYCPSVYNLQILYYLPMMFIYFWVLTWTTAPMAAFSKDFESLVSSIMTGLFWLSGIVYDTTKVKNNVIRHVFYFNPVNYFINGYRRTFLYNQPAFSADNRTETLIMFLELFCLILVGSFYFKRLRRLIPDVL